jgi:multiple sugar transport system substrate-binding protein
MAVEDKSVFLDLQNSPYTGLFNSGKIGMLVTGPWDLSSFPDVDYGVEILPGFDGDHQTIAGPDMWTVFDNEDGRAQAALDFIAWLTAPEQMKADALATGHLPFRLSVIDDAAFVDEFGKTLPGGSMAALAVVTTELRGLGLPPATTAASLAASGLLVLVGTGALAASRRRWHHHR